MVFQDQGGAFKVKTLSQIMIFEVRLRLFIFDDQGKNFLMMSVAFFKDQDFTFSLRALFSKIRHNFLRSRSRAIF